MEFYGPLKKQFDKIGARLVVRQTPRSQKPFDLNIRKDKTNGEHFTLTVRDAQEFRVLQANRAGRHLLLHATGDDGGERFLCGHDERHWFVAKVDERVSTVTEAKRALLPQALRDAGLTADDLARRHTDKFKRQGEWFFLPTDKDMGPYPVLHGEPLMRARGSKPHIVSELVRFGGTAVVLVGRKEYSEAEWDDMVRKGIEPKGHRGVQRMMKDPEVYVRGKVRHADHGTLVLDGWHRVYPNREGASLNLSFYD